MPHEKAAAVVWALEKEGRGRTHATSAQHDSTMGKPERKTKAKIDGQHQAGYESEWNREGCSGSEKVA